MSSALQALSLLQEWIRRWVVYQLVPWLGLNSPQALALGALKGTFDTLLIALLGLGVVSASRAYMDTEYALPRNVQSTVLKWAPVADRIAREADIPREVPLVIWFKESGMQAVNPENCTGIMGAYDLVRSGQHPCFTPGDISDLAVTEQLIIGAQEFKKRCPEISYWTTEEDVIKRCYFAYNAGMGAAARLDPNESAYVMNNFDDAHTGMVYSDIELGTVRMEALGAWPAHLSVQSLIASQLDIEERPTSWTLVDLGQRFYDWVYLVFNEVSAEEMPLSYPAIRSPGATVCLGEPHTLGNPRLRPRLNPVTTAPVLTQDIHGCSYNLPGLDISSSDASAVLQAPMPGEVTTFTDRWYNTTIRIENEEWVVWMLHPRSYLVEEGEVSRGQAVGIMGAVGNATGPHVHYTIYDKINETYVDPRDFVP